MCRFLISVLASKRKFNFDVAEDDEDMEVSQETPEQMRRRVMLESGGSVDYTA